MAKSTGNAYTLSDLLVLNFEPVAFRYLCLTAHYRARLNFTFTSLRAAQTGLRRLRQHVVQWGEPAEQFSADAEVCRVRFWTLACEDLALPRCLAVMWSLARGSGAVLPGEQKAALARDFDRLLALDLGLPTPYRLADPFRGAVSSPSAVADAWSAPDRCQLSVIVVVQPDEDLAAVERCVESVLRERHGLDLEVVLVDATGSPARHSSLVSRLQDDAQVRMVWIDHDPGAAAGRNLGLRISRGTYVVLLDPSVELVGETWPRLFGLLNNPGVGGVGPFGLLTADMRHYYEPPAVATPIEVDALQNYLMVFRRADLARVGPLDEHFRFYRILDLDLSYAIRDRVGELLTVGDVPVVLHRHALWEALSEGDREERSRKNFGRFLKRWDHRRDLARHGAGRTDLASAQAAVHG